MLFYVQVVSINKSFHTSMNGCHGCRASLQRKRRERGRHQVPQRSAGTASGHAGLARASQPILVPSWPILVPGDYVCFRRPEWRAAKSRTAKVKERPRSSARWSMRPHSPRHMRSSWERSVLANSDDYGGRGQREGGHQNEREHGVTKIS
jgi:hypothetical protein